MTSTSNRINSLIRIYLALGVVILGLFIIKPSVVTSSYPRPFKVLTTLYSSKFGIVNPAGFAFSRSEEGFLVWNEDQAGQKSIFLRDNGRSVSEVLKTIPIITSNAIFHPSTDEFLIFDDQNRTINFSSFLAENNILTAPKVDVTDGLPLDTISGMTIDPNGTVIYLLDGVEKTIQSISTLEVDQSQNVNPMSVDSNPYIPLKGLEGKQIRGLAYYSENDSFFIADIQYQIIYEVSFDGSILSEMDLSAAGLDNIQAITFAPSMDRTDEPEEQSLFILDGGMVDPSGSQVTSGRIVEVTLNPASLPVGTILLPSTLVRTFSTNNTVWAPSSPDPSGIDYLPGSQELIISDSEVDEMSVYQGANVFRTTTSGGLTNTCTTVPWNREPSGIAVNPANPNQYFFANDDDKKLFEVNPGVDGILCNSDDIRRFKDVTVDAEDLAYGINSIFVAGGTDAEVLMINLGLDGLLATADDGAPVNFDTKVLGFSDVEGITYNDQRDSLFLISTTGSENYLGEVSLVGTLLNVWSLSFMGTADNLRSGLTFAPGSLDPSVDNVYIVSRGIDNDYGPGHDPNENDGIVWEISLNAPPTATPTDTPTSTPTITNTPTSLPTATDSPTNTPTGTNTPTSLPTATDTPTITPIATDTATITPTSTEPATMTPTATNTPTVTPTPTQEIIVNPENKLIFLPMIIN